MNERPRLKREWAGRLVRLRRELRNGMVVLPQGLVMEVVRYHGTLHLKTERPCPVCEIRTRHSITKVHESDVELLAPQDSER